MHQWSEPSLIELEIGNTEYSARPSKYVDGSYMNFYSPIYSGEYVSEPSPQEKKK